MYIISLYLPFLRCHEYLKEELYTVEEIEKITGKKLDLIFVDSASSLDTIKTAKHYKLFQAREPHMFTLNVYLLSRMWCHQILREKMKKLGDLTTDVHHNFDHVVVGKLNENKLVGPRNAARTLLSNLKPQDILENSCQIYKEYLVTF
ncbi:hypothetical protein LXL04_020847 [Taraxacum kok-saghyz]